MSVWLSSALALPLLIYQHSRMPVHGGVSESLQNLFPCGVFWRALAISVELGGSTSSLCLSVSSCNSQAVQGCVSLPSLGALLPLFAGPSAAGLIL